MPWAISIHVSMMQGDILAYAKSQQQFLIKALHYLLQDWFVLVVVAAPAHENVYTQNCMLYVIF